ncbi:MAG TPA: 3-oxoacyl-[acyl-carrier-protein] synthase III C-terminal domain-containing protein [Acidimicrobiia bacterium]|nr:3-oxoacyl-[acyl-carrier-protein] synthase III C-terminal domain-containing protein [Acidimicrobiia bacterium]
MGSVIVGTGAGIPEQVVTNHDLARIMDTTDEWVVSRSGVHERRFAPPGTGSSDLAAEAVTAALADAGVDPGEVDALITATMTPDRYAPGIAGAVQHKAGLGHIGVFDLRAQCAGFLYGMDLADMLLATGRARTVVVVGAEVHAGYLPWGDSWEVVLGRSDGPISEEQRRINDETRGWAILFGDGAGAMVLQAGEADEGILASTIHTDGEHDELIVVPGLGFTHRPFADAAQIAAGLHLPRMDGGGLFRMAVRLMPEAVETVLRRIDRKTGDLDLVVAHQANGRIVEAVGRRLEIDPGKVPMNVGRYGNTTAATIPLLFHECRQEGMVPSGSLVAFTAFGAGAHWGAIAYQQP